MIIGNHVGISGSVLYCMKEIVVEDCVLLGVAATVYDMDFHALGAEARRNHDAEHIAAAPVRICHDAWIGADAMILRGVTAGARAIVAARAVVTRDVPPDTIVAGVPARPVKRVRGIKSAAAHYPAVGKTDRGPS